MSTSVPDATNPLDGPPASPGEAEWRRRVAAVLKGAPTDTLLARVDDFTLSPLHPPRRDVAPIPGRGAMPWRVVQRVDHPDHDAALRQVHEDLLNGADGLALVFPEAAAARGFGIAVEDAADLDLVLTGVELEMIGISLDAGPHAHRRAMQVAELVERRSLDPARMTVDFGLDPMCAFARGSASGWAAEVQAASAAVAGLVARGFAGPFLRADGRLWHEAGAGEIEELACLLATLTTYMRLLESHGHALEDARDMLSAVVAADQDQFVTMARIRALRLLWAQVEESCGLSPQPLAIHAETSWRMVTRGDPLNNVLRASLAAVAAGVAGVNSITVLPHTAAHGLPDAEARRLARNVSLALLAEGHLARVEDPAAGAGALEALTEDLAEHAWARFQELDRVTSDGTPGLVTALAEGTIATRMAESRARRTEALRAKRSVITGVTAFPPDRDRPVVVDRPTPAADPGEKSGLLPSVRLEDLVA